MTHLFRLVTQNLGTLLNTKKGLICPKQPRLGAQLRILSYPRSASTGGKFQGEILATDEIDFLVLGDIFLECIFD
jgi:hypothetical protein